MHIYSSHEIAGKEIKQHLGLVRGSTVQSKHIGRDFMAGLKTIVGGELRGYTELLEEARDQSVRRMIEQAELLGADTIIGVRFTSSAITSQASEILAYGTAVKLVY